MKVTLDLEELRARLAATDAETTETRLQLGRLQQRYADLSSLIELTERLYGQTQDDGEVGPVADQPAAEEDALDLASMDTKDAIVRLLSGTGKSWRVQELVTEMLRHGWRPRSETDNASSAVNTAVSRLARSNPHIVKPKYGFYAWRADIPSDNGELAVGVEAVGP